MGSLFSSTAYNVEDHGHSCQKLYDSYIADDSKFENLDGKIVAISGTSAGSLGFYLAQVAIRKNASKLLLVNRDSGSAKKGEAALKEIASSIQAPTQIETVICDMQDFATVKAAGAKINAIASKNGGLDVLALNAGIMATRDKRTKDGFEVQMQTNQLSHFLLTSIVYPSLVQASKKSGGSRLVTHSSSARDAPSRNLEEKFFGKCGPNTLGGDDTWFISEFLGYDGPWTRYHMTKLANSNFAMAMARKCKAAGVNIKCNSADPGLASSNLQVSSTQGDGLMGGWMAKLIMGSGQSAADGSLDIAMAAFGKESGGGDFYQPAKGATGPPMRTVIDGEPVKKGGEKLTCSKENQENVWKWCEEALGINFEI